MSSESEEAKTTSKTRGKDLSQHGLRQDVPTWAQSERLDGGACRAGEAPGLAEDAAGRDSSEAVLCRGFRAGHLTSSLNSTDNYQLKAGFRFSELGWFLCSCIQL